MKAFDTFCGTGWAVACRRLGISEDGVDNMKSVIDTREENGFRTVYYDVWEGLTHPKRRYDMKISSPPCQTFSNAGSGSGRKAFDEIIRLIDRRVYNSPTRLRKFTSEQDPRTALILTPLLHVYRDEPEMVVMEQVPTVLPVWDRMAEKMQEWGYHTWTGKLKSERYGVPQTRQRAFLIASSRGPVLPPSETHSEPVSIGEGLSWRPRKRDLWWQRSNYSDGKTGRGIRSAHKPSFTITGKPPTWIPAGTEDVVRTPGLRFRVEQLSALQTYPADFVWRGSVSDQYQMIGNAVPPLLAEAVLLSLTK